jgi:hypothetical protein
VSERRCVDHADLTNMSLLAANQLISDTTMGGIRDAHAHDVSGAGRSPSASNDWKVCNQNIPMSTPFNYYTRIELGVVADVEPRPRHFY